MYSPKSLNKKEEKFAESGQTTLKREKYSTRCWFFHDYGKWERFSRIFFSVLIDGSKVPNSENEQWYQRRKCKKCGFTQEKKFH